MRFEPISETRYEQVRLFLSELGWAKRVEDPVRFRRMMIGADSTVVVLDGETVIGFGRAITDGVSNGYISMLVVAPERRSQGIGSKIVRMLMGDDPEITWVLRAGRDSTEFWTRQGFTKSEIAMERTRSSLATMI